LIEELIERLFLNLLSERENLKNVKKRIFDERERERERDFGSVEKFF